jgi:hypothetical protein
LGSINMVKMSIGDLGSFADLNDLKILLSLGFFSSGDHFSGNKRDLVKVLKMSVAAIEIWPVVRSSAIIPALFQVTGTHGIDRLSCLHDHDGSEHRHKHGALHGSIEHEVAVVLLEVRHHDVAIDLDPLGSSHHWHLLGLASSHELDELVIPEHLGLLLKTNFWESDLDSLADIGLLGLSLWHSNQRDEVVGLTFLTP